MNYVSGASIQFLLVHNVMLNLVHTSVHTSAMDEVAATVIPTHQMRTLEHLYISQWQSYRWPTWCRGSGPRVSCHIAPWGCHDPGRHQTCLFCSCKGCSDSACPGLPLPNSVPPLLPLWSKNLPSLLIFNVHACVLALTFIMKNIKQKSGRQDCITHFHAPVAQLKKSLTGSRSCFSVSSTDFLSPVLFWSESKVSPFYL